MQSLKFDDYSMANGDVDDDDPFSANTFEVTLLFQHVPPPVHVTIFQTSALKYYYTIMCKLDIFIKF